MKTNFKEKLREINTFIFDVDGVLTDGSLYILPSGEFMRTMNSKDGFALKLALIKGYNIAIITGAKENSIKERLVRLGIENTFLNATNKLPVLKKYLSKNNLNLQNTLYMGDDIPDLECMKKVGLSCCPKNAVSELKDISDYISPLNGGDGCVRDIIEQVLRIKKKWSYKDGMEY
jgi:3-deoxy-D-manno-octulosonate 8-phosphate phosphatase (KDO 8-P phosphatase)